VPAPIISGLADFSPWVPAFLLVKAALPALRRRLFSYLSAGSSFSSTWRNDPGHPPGV